MNAGVTVETSSLIRPLQRTFYPTQIPQTHHQLKQFISTSAENDIIFFASEHEIYALHLSTRKRELIASLPWKPQCLDARHGWICVGGMCSGRCAFISIDGKGSNGLHRRSSHHEAEVDALLPLDLAPESRMLAHSYFQRLRASSPSAQDKPEIQIHELGGSIMNSVTIHRLQNDQMEDEIVCVMTNNDCSLRVWSLSRSRQLDILHFSTAMNHAVISPDGQTLLAVGDEPKAYFCRRMPISRLSGREGDSDTTWKWQETAVAKLAPAAPKDACFTTAFSPSGHICAVAQQSGYVTIFDTSMIHEDMQDGDAIIKVLRSSRPCLSDVRGDYAGAVRSMSFSPPPWDLLAWAEDQGRICVTDLRNSCHSRQTVELDLDSPRLNRATVVDLDDGHSTAEQRELEIERRFLQRQREALNAQNDLSSVGHVADYIEFSAARRRLQRDTAPIPGEFNDLTDSERQMLDSLRSNNFQGNLNPDTQRDLRRPFSVSYLHDQNLGPPEAHIRAHSPPSSSGERVSAQLARLSRMRDASRGDHPERSRTYDRGSYQPRRRSSMVITSSDNHSSNQSSSAHPSSLAPIGSTITTLSASPSRLGSVVANAENSEDHDPLPNYDSVDAWQTVADAMGNTASSEVASHQQLRRQRRDETINRDSGSTAAMLRLLQQQQQTTARLERLRNLQNPSARQQFQALNRAMARERGDESEELEMRRQLTAPDSRRENGVTTMGIGWQGDGRRLYVATEEGILELTVNLDERKQFPSMAYQ